MLKHTDSWTIRGRERGGWGTDPQAVENPHIPFDSPQNLLLSSLGTHGDWFQDSLLISKSTEAPVPYVKWHRTKRTAGPPSPDSRPRWKTTVLAPQLVKSSMQNPGKSWGPLLIPKGMTDETDLGHDDVKPHRRKKPPAYFLETE